MLVTRGNETNALAYTVGAEQLRIEVIGSTSPHPVNIVELKSGRDSSSENRRSDVIAADGC